jgi:hypothetical protein
MAEPAQGNADAGAAQAGAAAVSADNGHRQPGNADLLSQAFAGADGAKPAAKPQEGDTAAGGAQAGSGGAKEKLAPWAEQLPAELRDNPDAAAKLAKFPKVGDMAKAYLDLEGRPPGIAIPGKDAAPEAVAAFWEQAGRPKTAEGYSFAADAGRGGAAFAQAAFAACLTEAQAASLFAGLESIGERSAQAIRDARARQRAETAAALEKEHGSRYPEQMELLARGLAAAGPNVARLLEQAGLSGEPEIVKAFIAYGKMTAESGASRGGGAGAPLQSVFEGGSFDYNEEGT